MSKRNCKVDGCEKNHIKHYCRVCDQNNSDHFSRHCPEGIVLYHGTNFEVIKSIVEEGFIKSGPHSRLGVGVYFVESEVEAGRISLNRDSKGPHREKKVVLKCLVNLGNHIFLDSGDGSDWQNKYDSASSMHSPWAGIETDFKEFCVKNSKRCVVNSIILNNIKVLKEQDMTLNEAHEELKNIVIILCNVDFF